MNKIIHFQDIGVQEYKPVWQFQEETLQQIIQTKRINKNEGQNIPTKNYLLFVEHPHVYTLGKSGDETNLLANQDKLKEINATYVKSNRGGDITYHGFGQLVTYPILDLDNFKTDIHWYMRCLEEVIIRTLDVFGLKGERSKGETGVWLDVGKPYARKICAMGVRSSRWVTMHGLALNVNTDLRYFEYIIPCGIKDKAVTSLKQELEKELDFEKVKAIVLGHFQSVFEAEIEHVGFYSNP